MKLVLALIPAFAAGTPALSQESVPTIDVTPSCRAAAANVSVLKQDIEACRRSEDAARESLVKQWANFNPADRKGCYGLTTTGTPGTYTELLTCLEMRRDARKLPDTTTIGRGLGQ
jgi:hypothetical protein